MELFRIVGTIAIDNAKALESLDETSKQAESTSAKIGSKLSKAGKTLTSCLTKPALAAGAAVAGIALGKGWSRMVQIDNAKAKLVGLGHSADSVKEIMNNALESVKGTAYGLDSAATTAASAVAAGIPVGEELTRYLTLVGDAAAIAGTDMAEMGSIFNKVAANGKISAEEMNQLADRGIPIFQLFSEATGMSMEEVRKAVSEGKIGIEEFQDAIEQGMGGAAKELGNKTISGAIANISAAIGRVGANFLGSADDSKTFAGQLLPVLIDVQEWLGKVEEKAKVLGQSFGKFFNKTVETLKGIPAPVAGIGTAIALLAGPTLQLTAKIIAMAGKFKKTVDVINSARVAVKNYQLATEGASLAAGVANGQLTRKQAIIGDVSNALGKLRWATIREKGATVASTAATTASTLATTVNTTGKKIATVATNIYSKSLGRLTKAHKLAALAAFGFAAPIIALIAYMATTGDSAEETAAKITAFSNKLADTITAFADELPAMIDAIMPAITEMVSALVSALPALIAALVPAIKKVITAVVGVLPTLLPVVVDAGIELFMALVDSLQQIIEPLVAALPVIIDAVLQALPILIPALIDAAVTLWMAFVQAMPKVISALVNALPKIVQAIKQGLVDACTRLWESMKPIATEKWNAIKNAITEKIQQAKKSVSNTLSKIKAAFSFDALISKVRQKFNNIKNSITQPINDAKSKVSSMLKKIKGMFPLSIGKVFSNLKLPTIKFLDKGKAPYGLGGLGRLPKLTIKWNAKGAIFDKPTIFATPQGLQGVGEAGKEAVAPIDTLKAYVAEAVASQNGEMVSILSEILSAIRDMDAGMYQNIEQALDNRKIEWNSRELGRFVKTYA